MPIPYRLNPLGISVREELPLTFTAVEASTVKLTATGSPTVSGLHYRLGTSGPWLPYTIGNTINLAAGEKVQFWNSVNRLSTGNSTYCYFVLSGKVSATGNLMSLLNYADTIPQYGFRKLFTGASALVSCPHDLTAKSIGAYGCAGTFELCSGMLTPIREIAIDTLAENCFDSMYARCGSIPYLSHVKATVMAPYCCTLMYYMCGNITSAYIPDVTLADYCFRRMFYYSSSLSGINTDITSWHQTATFEWLSGVAAFGTFIKTAALPEEYGTSRIPSGWTVINK